MTASEPKKSMGQNKIVASPRFNCNPDELGRVILGDALDVREYVARFVAAQPEDVEDA